MNAYFYLLIAVMLEVCGTMLLPVTQNFTKPLPTLGLAISYMASFYLLTHVLSFLPIAIVYAIWSGLGIFLVALLGYFIFNQSLSWQAALGMVLIIIGIALVNTYSSAHV